MTDNLPPQESLAEELDRVLAFDQEVFEQNSADPLVGAALRLAKAPMPQLNPEALARIEAQVLSAKPIAPKQPLRHLFTITGAAAALVLLFGIIMIAAQNAMPGDVLYFVKEITSNIQVASANSTPTATSDATDLPITADIDATDTTEFVQITVTSIQSTAFVSQTPVVETESPVTPTPNVSVLTQVFTDTPAAIPTLVETATPIPVVPEFTSTPVVSGSVAIILEGPIEEIEDNTITIYGIRVQLAPEDPLLKVLRVEDYLRIEGDVQANTPEQTEIVVIAQVVSLDNPNPVDNEVYVNPEGNDAWRDNGDCSNPPPAWAAAVGWRNRCEQAAPSNNNPNQNDGNAENNNNNGNANGNNGNGNGGNSNGNGNGNSNGNANANGNNGNGNANGNANGNNGNGNGNNGGNSNGNGDDDDEGDDD